MRVPLLAAALLLAPALWGSSSKGVPSWVEELSTRQLPAYSGKVPAAVLLNEQHVTFDPAGTVTLVERHAIKILTQQGKRDAYVRVHYWKNRRDVKDLHAWLITPSGFQKTFEKKDVIDAGEFETFELYAEGRYRAILADNPEIGSVFAYEYTSQDKSLTAQDQFMFQRALPSLLSRYTVTLPAGWSAKGVVFNQPGVQPIVDGSSYTWEIKDLPFRDANDESGATFPRLVVSFVPPAGTPSSVPIVASWTDMSRHEFSLAEGQDEATPEIAAKVAQLTAGAKSDYDKICAIGHYVQTIRYVEIAMDLEHGGGSTPHAAGEVFSKQYGDCKDKANLMRCMLKSAGLQSYLLDVYSGDPSYVRKEFPSDQFNHMILAAKVSDSVSVPTTISSPFGRLLIFDPTDTKTPVGDLPFYEQGSFGLLLAGDRGDLLKLPAVPPEANLYDVQIDATLDPNGQLSASLINSKTGQPASRERHIEAAESPDQYKTKFQEFLNENAKGVVISSLTPEDHFEQNNFELKVQFSSPYYAQLMQGRLLVFNPAVVQIAPSVAPRYAKEEKRVSPIVINSALYKKTVRFKLPAGFTIDEPPVPVKYESEFAKFSLSFKQEPGMLVMTEELRTEPAILPAEQFEKVKKFFDNCYGADRQNAVLVKN